MSISAAADRRNFSVYRGPPQGGTPEDMQTPPRANTAEEFHDRRSARQRLNAKPARIYHDMVRQTRLSDEKHVQKLIAFVDRSQHPYIGVGTHCGYNYRLEQITGLLVVSEENIWHDDPHECAHGYIVGIDIPDGWRLTNDTSVESVRRRAGRKRKNRSSEESYFSASSSSSEDSTFDPENKYGFAFMQLGKAMNISASDFENAKVQAEEESNMRWEYSGYVVGVTTNGPDGRQPGTPGKVWLLYYFNPQDKLTGCVFHLDKSSEWGYLLGQECGNGDSERRGGFKIANSFAELRPDFQWNIDKYFDRVYDMTPAQIFKDHTLGSFIARQPLNA
ncbi:uncharacterized protein M421DRAFT_406301 [Didymella exigua CBS 183.55]|uniref:Uncharacterized protein n=1 Tax=Didymella exigua CBS 183.55 TaxID=1150837 RepID=A0A6A5RX58_9PLEO|nr:uncharacterized protein M421DRAFT_406301 [Didymella exigua CBS 183.55]KAF1931930.1 hypothetical protein M421DRAFT_406301 [Didymella exigua CBS 183.55]